jgi:soluble lytic murein transglycosylase
MMFKRQATALTVAVSVLTSAAIGQTHGPADGEAGAWHLVRDVTPLLERSAPSLDDIMAVVRAEIVLGRADRAQAVLSRFAAIFDTTQASMLALRAEVLQATDDPAEAGRLLAQAASLSDGVWRGAYHARAGNAYEVAGYVRLAARHYANAAKELRAIRGWLAIREARVTENPSEAFKLLRRAPPPAQRMASLARADVYLAAGDSARAIEVFMGVGLHRRAAHLALEVGDTALARSELYRTLESDAVADVVWALARLEERYVPETSEQLWSLAGAHRFTDRRRAIEYAKQVVTHGDSSIAKLLFLADLYRDAGRFPEALDTYAAARERGSATAFYRYARLLDRVGRSTDSREALLAFAEMHPRSSVAPISVFLVAEARRRQGRAVRADSLYRSVAIRWPRARYAGRARLQLAATALASRDTATAMTWYEEEIAVRGQQRQAARFQLARLRQAIGDSTGAMEELMALAHEDSIGYYGTIAREVGNLPEPDFAPFYELIPNPWVGSALAQLDALGRAGLAPEVTEFVAHLTGLRDIDWRDMLALAEGLSQRGWVVEGVRLGWRVAELHTLNDVRVLRVIFPWPLRELIEREADKHGLDPYLVAGLIRQESAFRPRVVSRAGAVGLMQLMPGTAWDIARRSGVEWQQAWVEVADANLHLGTTHLAGLLKRYGRVGPALAAYNAGGRPVARWLQYPEAGDTYRFVERIPYVETRGYVRTVLRNQALYRALYPKPSTTTATP